METEEKVIVVSAVVLRDEDDRILTVRKRGTDRFMLPGGKPEAGESPVETAVREVAEELNVRLTEDALDLLGVVRAAAANEAGFEVEGTTFVAPAPVVASKIAPAAEIEEIRWLNADADTLPSDLAPMLEEQVLPLLLSLR
ncbi:NUDIX domain-containing protein [Pseudoclavibacter alba]|uniref:NUDIX domain-containing protein n=1 Tax=Pseudoclavibacter albus TaxID=272241 RepID=A0ABT2HW88_9MICO|nr:NUDIX domain-containing protein [Pseudoclavibacter alba]MCT2042584.1 NUDIX domain-containing protein [Pseudoclavibacter alba]